VQPVVFNLGEIVAETGKMLRRLIGEDVKLEMHIMSDALVRADRGQLQQVLTNLAVNARDAMPNGGMLSIATSSATIERTDLATHPDLPGPGEYVVLTVRDNGTGMTPEVRARIFEPFFTTKERGKGTGLGLATSHGIVKQAGGGIAVQSEPGIGTTFRIYLPRHTSPATAETVADQIPPRGSERILMVEDEVAVRRVGARLLRSQGYDVIEAGDGSEALRLLENGGDRIDLLFTDVVLPGMGGRELADRVREVRPGIKVLFTTGYTDDVVLQHRLAARDVLLVHKPYSRLVLAEKVRSALDGNV
jgi:CheY-like chemotaxis protein